MNTDASEQLDQLPTNAEFNANEYVWIDELKAFMEGRSTSLGFKVSGLINASKHPINGIVIDGTLITIADTVVLNTLELIKTDGVNPWTKPPEPAEAILTGGETDTLIALVERGPLNDGDVPSKSARDSLVEKGLAARVIVNGEDGYQAATYNGRDVYERLFNGNSIQEAMSNRKTATQRVTVEPTTTASSSNISLRD